MSQNLDKGPQRGWYTSGRYVMVHLQDPRNKPLNGHLNRTGNTSKTEGRDQGKGAKKHREIFSKVE